MLKRSLQQARCAAPGDGDRSLVVTGAGLIAVTYGVVRYGYGLHLPELAAEFSLSPRLAGAIGSGSFAAYCVAALAAWRLVGRRGARVVLWLAAGLAAVGALVVASSWSAPVLALGVLVAGGAAGAASPALVVAVASTVSQRSVPRAQAMVNAGTGAGVAVAGAVVLVAPSAWRPVWALGAVAALGAAFAVDRRTRWPSRTAEDPPPREPEPTPRSRRLLVRPLAAATVAGAGSAAVWTFGRDLLTTTGGLPAPTTAALWSLLGAAAVLGALSGDAVRVLGLRRAWALTAVLSATGTAVLALAPSCVPAAAVAGAVFGGAYTALSGVLIAWAGVLRPQAAGATTAALFIALTAGQAVGATATGTLAEHLGAPGAFLVGAALLLTAAGVLPGRADRTGPSAGRGEQRSARS